MPNRHATHPERLLFVGKCLLAVGILHVMIGCSSKARESIEGVVTFDGKPVLKGQIKFIPIAGTNGPTAGAVISDGRYFIDAEKGLKPGKYRVEITAMRPGSETTQAINPMTGGMETTESVEAYIPSRYNRESELIAEVKADVANQADFELTP